MEPECSLPCLQEPATGPYPEPDESSLHPIPLTSAEIVILPSGPTPRCKTYAFLVSPVRATCPAHLILLDLITLLIFVEEYNYETPRFAIFYIFLLISLNEAHIYSWTPCYETHSSSRYYYDH
jgi:hypothetical protein